MADHGPPSWGDDFTAVHQGQPPTTTLPGAATFDPRPGPYAPHLPPPPRTGGRWKGAVLTLLLIAAIAVGTFLYITRDVPTEIEVGGRPITNAGSILERAESAFADLASADGATPAAGSGCWFAPPVDKASAWQGPRLACGPVLLGVSGTTKPWVIGRALYSTNLNGREATGTFDAFESVAAPDTDDFVRPDGRAVPDSSRLAPARGGIRTADGRRLVDDQAVIDTVDGAFMTAVAESGAAGSEGSLCFFGGATNEADQFLTDGSLWCGPVLLGDSAPGALWAQSSFTAGTGDSFAVADATPPPSFELGATSPLPPGVSLVRPDGRQPVDGTGLRPPVAGPVARTIEVLPEAPAGVQLQAPADGRLHLPSRTLLLTGLGRIDQAGAEAEEVAVAGGETVVVATFESAAVEGGPADGGTAQLVVDGEASPFDGWSALPATGALTVSVPADAQDVTLEVVFDGLSQKISLLTGERAGGFPAVLYRDGTTAAIGAEFVAEAAMPAGDGATASGVVGGVRLVAWLDGRGWAAPGRAFLAVDITDWQAEPPCCEVTGAALIPVFTMAPAGQPRVDTVVAVDAARPTPVFDVPADFTAGELELRLLVTFQRDGSPGSAGGDPVPMAVDLPA